jgi:RNA polymerase sigma factor (TIGR02999 family)
MRAEGPGHTLQPTALTHEAYLRIARQPGGQWLDRAHFLASAAVAMRRILVEHARARHRIKRGGGWERVPLSRIPDLPGAGGEDPVDALALEKALQALAETDERKARVVELLYFGGITAEEAGAVLGISGRTVERDWQYARLWLLRAITGG